MTVGAYTFATRDWKDLEYPLDLYIKWNHLHFDEVAIYTYGNIDIQSDIPSNVKIIQGIDPQSKGLDFYRFGLHNAMRELSTDWKVYLALDEFIERRIDTSNLNRHLAYPLRRIDLYGNVQTAIEGAFVRYQYCIHNGNRRLLGDGGSMMPPYSGRIHMDGVAAFVKQLITRRPTYRDEPIFTTNSFPGTLYHTNSLRSPERMSKKWLLQFTREIDGGIRRDDFNNGLKKVLLKPFRYEDYKLYWPRAKLIRVEPPSIILENRERFVNVNLSA
jgi:hypothetical protein